MTKDEAIKELEILKEDYWDDDGYGHETKQYDDTMLALNMAIKALEQKPKRGKWIVHPLIDEGRVELECPICGETFIRAVNHKPHFCENCGVRMR